MIVPNLIFADSALWMFRKHVCASDPFPHFVTECGNPWPWRYNIVVKPKDPYFYADPLTDFNN